MKVSKKSFTISYSGTKNFQSVKITEGFEVEVDETFSELEEVLKEVENFSREREINDQIN